MERTGKPVTLGVPTAAAGQGQRGTFNLMLDFRAHNSFQPNATAGNMLRHVGILPVQSKVKSGLPQGPSS